MAIYHCVRDVEVSICLFRFEGFKLLAQFVYGGGLPIDQLNMKLFGCCTAQVGSLAAAAVVRIVQDQHPIKLRQNFLENFETFRGEIRGRVLNTRKSAAGFGKTLHESAQHWIGSYSKNNRGLRGGVFYGYGGRRRNRIDQAHFVALESLGGLVNHFWVACGLADLQRYFLPIIESQIP